ncbi:molecular chaperone DnaJ, partial [Candidatus Parcubacteria bacterium]
EVNEAYQVLGNPQKRAQYDKFGAAFDQARGAGFDNFGNFSSYGFDINFGDLGDIFEGLGDIFGFNPSGRRTSSTRRRGRDIEASITVSFLESVFGASKELSIDKLVSCQHCGGSGAEPGSQPQVCPTCNGLGRIIRMQRTFLGNIQTQTTCPQCRGEGKIIKDKCTQCRGTGVLKQMVKLAVNIPAGIKDGEVIRLRGQGEAGARGGEAGDLYLRVKVLPDPRFRREGYNILSRIFISVTQAAVGDKIEIDTVDGPVKLKIPAGTQPGTVFRLRGKGVPRLNQRGRGDHLVEVQVRIPTNLTRSQKQQLQALGI